jgi:hypothetical protein
LSFVENKVAAKKMPFHGESVLKPAEGDNIGLHWPTPGRMSAQLNEEPEHAGKVEACK